MADGPGAAGEQGTQARVCSPDLVPCLSRPFGESYGPDLWTCVARVHGGRRYLHRRNYAHGPHPLLLIQVHAFVKGSDLSLTSVLELGEVRDQLTTSMSMGWMLMELRYQ